MNSILSYRSFVCFMVLISAARTTLGSEGVAFSLSQQRAIRPLLSDRCFQCHGPDQKKREGNLRLDQQASALQGGENGPAIVSGNRGQSKLWERIQSTDPDLMMPPPESGKTLSAAEKELLGQWIDAGAPWSEHWAFAAVQRPSLPLVADTQWARAPWDNFVLAALEKEQLPPNQVADRKTLVRRLYLDLIGLPPSGDQVKQFLEDSSPDAYERLVDRLLASPAYGERWGRSWLDAARYADSDGFEKDKPRQVWFYRDWVVQALNRDLPYHQFLAEQIAGDLLPNASQDQKVATGFLRNSMVNEEGGIDPEQFRMEAMFDRMDAVGKAILGLTISCSQCHDHKFDPITQEDYYRLFAYLNNSHEGSLAVYTLEEQRKCDEINSEVRRIEDMLREKVGDWKNLSAWERTVRGNQPSWKSLELQWDDGSLGGQKMLPEGDGSYLAQGYAPTKFEPWGVATIAKSESTEAGFRALRLELLTDPNLPRQGPGRALNGAAALTDIKVFVAPLGQPDKKEQVKIVSATADVALPETNLPPIYDDRSGKRRVLGPIEYAIDGNDETAWSTEIDAGRRNQSRNAVFVFEKPIAFSEGVQVWVHLRQMHGGWNSDDNQTNNLGRFRVSLTTQRNPKADDLPIDVREIVEKVPAENRSEEQWQRVFSVWRERVTEFAETNQQIEKLWSQHPEGSSQLVLSERAVARNTNILKRGDFLKPDRPVSPGIPALLSSSTIQAATDNSQHRSDRRDLAAWLGDRSHPTTARTFVNRVWQSMFGIGLVNTPEDLGSQGEQPRHQDLLDWLSAEFMENDWSVKHLHRSIVLSATYQQSSVVRPDHLERDPMNRLLARSSRVRLDGELVRDVSLAVAGLLDHRVGGKPVYPPAPKMLFEPPVSYGPKVWDESTGGDRFRRSVYTFRFRSVPYPPLQVFDTPNGDAACIRRSSSNTPLQALTSLNETVFVECAQALARLVLREGPSDDRERLKFAFERVVVRQPSDLELDVLVKLLEASRSQLSQSPDATVLAGTADSSLASLPVPNISPSELAAWTTIARSLLNLDETITKE